MKNTTIDALSINEKIKKISDEIATKSGEITAISAGIASLGHYASINQEPFKFAEFAASGEEILIMLSLAGKINNEISELTGQLFHLANEIK